MGTRHKINELERLLRDLNDEYNDVGKIPGKLNDVIDYFYDFAPETNNNVASELEDLKEQTGDHKIGVAISYAEAELDVAEKEKEEEDRIDYGE